MKANKTFRGATMVFVVGVAAAFSLPALTQAQSVRVNWSKRAPFSDYKTFQWIPSQNPNHPFYRQYVDQYAEADLEKRGLHKVSGSQAPDLLVTYHYLTQEGMDTETYGYGGGGWGGWGWGGWGMGGPMYTSTRQVPETLGILTIDIIDAKTKKIVWRGQATEDNATKTGKAEEKDVAKSIHKMLDHFPPK